MEKMNKKNRNNVREKLIEENGNICCICGRQFDESNIPTIDHIIPISRGGTDEIDNLQLTCQACNIRKSNKIFNSEIFENYIQKIIQTSKRYAIIKNKEQDCGVDFIIKDKEKEEYKICHVKATTAFTTDRIHRMIGNFKECEINYRKRYKQVTSVLIFPGKMAGKNIEALKANGIEIWDRDYLVSEFENEILKLNNPYFNSILRFFYERPKTLDNQYDQKIEKLKKCKAGIENWSYYQKTLEEILELLFCPPLNKPIGELYDHVKANRRDFIMPNYAEEGFWKFARQNYMADFIVIDAKNSAKGVKKQDILQMANYLKRHGVGLFGIIIARTYNEKRTREILNEIWGFQNKMIVILDDNDIEQMLIEKKNNGEPEKIIRQKIEDFRISI